MRDAKDGGGRQSFDRKDFDDELLDSALPPSMSEEEVRRGTRGQWAPGVDTEPPPGINWSGFKDDRPKDEPEVEEADDGYEEDEPDWDQRARDALEFSTTYLDQNYRKQWDDSLRAFNNTHPGDSKYNTETFKKRSALFVPKTRSVIRKNEAAAAAAFFSNMDRTSIKAQNQADLRQRISAELNQSLLQYRLTKSVPWFHVIMGGCQDAQTMGACIWNPQWQYVTTRDQKTRELKLLRDEPEVRLVPLENFRFDPSANWMDPVNSSPYTIEQIPMYWCDVQDRMQRPDPKGRVWKQVDASSAFGGDRDDSTRQARIAPRIDPTGAQRPISDYDIVWVDRHIHRWCGVDFEWYTLRSEIRLTDPAPLIDSEFHGKRPYVMGLWILEAHKALPTSVPTLTKPIQDEANELRNSRLDAVKFHINPGFFAKRGKNVDLPALVRNVPGRVCLVDDPDGDVKQMETRDLPQSSYLEEDRNSQSFDDLVGNFNPMAMQQQRSPRESQGTVRMLQTPANMLTEYALLTFCETGVRPLVEMLVLLEQHYETDKKILAIAGQKAQAYQKYGLDEITDELLDAELTTAVNVGMGSTDPVMKLQRFLSALVGFANLAKAPPPGVNLGEVFKEIMSLSGYQDGDRFSMGQNPELAKLQQVIKQLQQKLQQLMMERRDKRDSNVVKLHTARLNNLTKMVLADKEDKHQNLHLYVEHLMAKDLQQDQAQIASGSQLQEAALRPTPEPASAAPGA